MAALLTPSSLLVLRSYVRNLALERAGDTGLITDAELNDILNIASRMVWLRIATKYPDVFAQRSASNVVVPASGIVAFASVSASSNIFRILNAYAGVTGAAEGTMSMINTFDRVASRHVYEPYIPAPALPFRYYVEGNNVVFSPVCSGTYDARFTWAQMPLDMVADGDLLWSGLQPMYHDTVAILGVQMTVFKDQPMAFAGVFQFLDNMLTANFGPPSNPYESTPKEVRP
jgi:hypothetical protein